jgi:hypothetical protein
MTPTPATSDTRSKMGLAATGYLVNGVSLFSPSDAFSYNNAGVWNRNAYVFELSSMDSVNFHFSLNNF